MFDFVVCSSKQLESGAGKVKQGMVLYPKIDDVTREKVLLCLLAASKFKGVGYARLKQLFDSGALLNLLSGKKKQEQFPLLLNEGDGLQNGTDGLLRNLHSAGRDVEELIKRGIGFIPRGHKDYPEKLSALQDPPRWIFYQGNLQVLSASATIAIVGTRRPSPAGKKLAYDCAKYLTTRDVVVLSGLARGIDEVSHQAAVDYYGRSVAILGHGLEPKYASYNHKLARRILDLEGILISEFLPRTPPSNRTFLRRNELQVALSNAVIPAECPSLQSGTAATVRRALRLEVPVLGIMPSANIEDSMLQTQQSLSLLGISFSYVNENNFEDLMPKLKSAVPQHSWRISCAATAIRMLKDDERGLLEKSQRIDLDIDHIHNILREMRLTRQRLEKLSHSDTSRAND